MVTFLVVHRSRVLDATAHVVTGEAAEDERSRSTPPTQTGNERSRSAPPTQTGNEGNEFVAGYVALGDDDSGHAMFEGAGTLGPGDAVANCITVDYRGSLPAGVSFAAEASGPLADDLDMTVEVGRGGGFGDCVGFAPEAQIFKGTLASLTRQHPPDRPLPAFDTTGPESVTMRVDVRLGDDGAQGDRTTAQFSWIAEPNV